MSLPIVKITKYDLLMNNIPVPFASDGCLIVIEDTGEIFHWEPKQYLDAMWGNACIDRYTKLISQITPAIQNIGYTVDINGRIERPYENIGYSDRTTTSSLKYTGRGGSTVSYGSGGASTAYSLDEMSYVYPHFEYTSRKEAIDTYSRMTLKVDGKHVLCLACGRFIHTPKIGKYNKRYCDNCGCYMPEIIFGKE